MSSLQLYNRVSVECSKCLTNHYSTSFSSGIRLFHSSLRGPIYSIYGFVRVADEIVDTFHNYNKELLFNQFRANLELDFKNGISTNPIINAYIRVCEDYAIPYIYTDAFLDSMEMDLNHTNLTKELYDKYIYGSAEVVGLMCLKVFCNENPSQFEELKTFAQNLGSAFQKVNFLRDLKSDLEERGRTYFPNVNNSRFEQDIKFKIEQEINEEFELAFKGISELPIRARLGVYVAYKYYLNLLKKIKKCDAIEIQKKRVRVGDLEKFRILLSSFIKFKARLI